MSGDVVRGTVPLQYASKSDIVCAMLRELIISGELAAGEALRQRDLAARFGVSQTPVREALRRLESEGLVVNDPHREVVTDQCTERAHPVRNTDRCLAHEAA